MAGPESSFLPHTVQDKELSDEQMEQLLARATDRLQQQRGAVSKTGQQNSYSFPKLNAGKLEKPYMASKGDVATVDASRLLEEKERKKANGIRSVEDPLMAKQVALEVSILAFDDAIRYEENNPIHT